MTKLHEAHPNIKITSTVVYFADNRLLVPRVFVQEDMGVTSRSIMNWEKQGLDSSPLSLPKLKLYDLKQLRQWHKDNIDQKQSARSSRGRDVELDEDADDEDNPFANMDLDKVPKVEAERRKEIEAVKKLMMQNDELEGRLVSVDDLDKAMAEQAAIHISDKTNDEKTLPTLLANKSQEEISNLLYKHNQDKIETLGRIVAKEFDCGETLYDVIFAVLEKFDDGVSPKEIIKVIDGIS